MAQHDIEVEVGVKPILELKDFDASIKKLKSMAQKGVNGLSSKQSAEFTSLASQAISFLMRTGRATTATQGRLQIASEIGATTGGTAARLRTAQNISATEFMLGKNQQKTLDTFEKRFLRTQRSVSGFLENPTAKGRESLLDTISSLEEDTKELLKTYRKSGQEVPKILKDSNKSTKKWQNEVLKAKIPFSGLNMLGMLSRLTGIGTLASGVMSLLNKTQEATQRSIARGDKNIDEMLMYGQNLSIPAIKTYATLYQMKEADIASIQKQAIMWHARAMTGRLSADESMVLSKLNLLELIQSGEAERSPWAYMAQVQKTIRDYQEQGKSAELLQYLQLANLPASLARLGMTTYTPAQIQETRALYEKEVENNIKSSVRSLPLRSDWQSTGELITSGIGKGVTGLLNIPSVLATNPELITGSVKALTGNPESIVQTINNVFNLYGKPEENKEEILDIFENQNRMNVNKLIGIKGTMQ